MRRINGNIFSHYLSVFILISFKFIGLKRNFPCYYNNIECNLDIYNRKMNLLSHIASGYDQVRNVECNLSVRLWRQERKVRRWER